MNKQEQKTVFFVVNENYFSKMLVTLYSVLKHNNAVFAFYVVNTDVPSEMFDGINEHIFPSRIVDVKVDNSLFKGANTMRGDLNYTAYIKTLLPDIMQQQGIENALFLDCDLIVVSPILELFSFRQSSIYAKYDKFCVEHNKEYFQTKHIDYTRYFNSGVMVLNSIDEYRYIERLKCLIYERGLDFRFHDQDILNILYADNNMCLPDKYNHFTHIIGFKTLFFHHKSSILHYCNLKPWYKGYFGRYKRLYYMYYTEAEAFFDKKFDFYHSSNPIEVIKSLFSKIKSVLD